MANEAANVRRRLRERFSRYLAHTSRYRSPLVAALNRIAALSEDAFVFGGFLRDLAIRDGPVAPRDIDVVVSSGDLQALAVEFGSALRRHTRFGGLVLNVSGWRIDVWELADTWAFRAGLVAPVDFMNLPLTTFLNLEAVAIEIVPRKGRKRRLFEHGFLEAVTNRQVEINLSDNPYRDLAIVRSLVVASRTGYALGPELRGFILKYSDTESLEALISVQRDHYGAVRRQKAILRAWLKYLERLGTETETQAILPPPDGIQLEFWDTQNWEALRKRPWVR